jgi:hypothetical protein
VAVSGQTAGGMTDNPPAAAHRLPVLLWAGAVLAAVAAGLLLWAERGTQVFVDMLSATLAWCF